MTTILCRILVFLLVRETGIGTVRQSEITAGSDHLWTVRPIASESFSYHAVELAWRDREVSTPRVEGIGPHVTYITRHRDGISVLISAVHRILPSDLRIVSPQKPSFVAFRIHAGCETAGRDTTSKHDGLIWMFRHKDHHPGSWSTRGIFPVDECSEDEPGRYRTDGTGKFVTTDQLRSIDAAHHPVAFIQYQVDSGVGNSLLSWETSDETVGGTMQMRTHPLGTWNQLLIPLYTHSEWHGNIRSVSFSPVDHPALFQLDWISFPLLRAPWSWMIHSGRVQAISFGILFVIILIGAFIFRSSVFPDIRYLLITTCAITPILLPFGCIQARITLAGIPIPLYIFVLATLSLYTIIRQNSSWIVRSAVVCILISIVHGYRVAEGAGSETLPILLGGPLAFLAAYGLSSTDQRRTSIVFIVGTIAFSGMWIAISSFLSHDPLYGSLMATIGRTYQDIAADGRISGGFVHPLVLASCALIAISTLREFPRNTYIRIPFIVILVFIITMTQSRSAIIMVFLIISTLLLRRNTRRMYAILIAGVFLGIVILFTRADESPGIFRDLHIAKRADGVRVAATTIAHKPLQGVGWGNYKHAVRRFGPERAKLRSYTTPDSSYARLVVEGGLVGLSAWVLWLISLFGYNPQRPANDSYRKAFSGWHLTAVIMIFMAGVFDAFYWPAFSVPACALLGCMRS